MEKNSEEELKNIARQLSCPEGEYGIKTAEIMHINNIGMTRSAIDALEIRAAEKVLEIGHGNAAHIAYLFSKTENIQYFGADISETIITEAKKINSEFIKKGIAHFQLTDGEILPFNGDQFDKIFTVNTIYFWKKPISYLQEIKRVLKPDGSFALCFADKCFMETLPFTPYGFELYDLEKAKRLLFETGFQIEKIISKTESIQSNTGLSVARDYHLIIAST